MESIPVDTINKILFSVVVPIFVTLVTIYIKEQLNQRKKNKEDIFNLYMELIEMRGLYEFLSWKEYREENYWPDLEYKIFVKSHGISDMLRKVKTSVKKDILQALFLKNLSCKEREEKLNSLIDILGKKLNPEHKKIMGEINDQNLNQILNESR